MPSNIERVEGALSKPAAITISGQRDNTGNASADAFIATANVRMLDGSQFTKTMTTSNNNF